MTALYARTAHKGANQRMGLKNQPKKTVMPALAHKITIS